MEFNAAVAVQAINYLLWRDETLSPFSLYAILCFADHFHLAEHGHFMTGDTYEFGVFPPVPKAMHALIRATDPGLAFRLYIDASGFECHSDAEPATDRLTESNIEALDTALRLHFERQLDSYDFTPPFAPTKADIPPSSPGTLNTEQVIADLAKNRIHEQIFYAAFLG